MAVQETIAELQAQAGAFTDPQEGLKDLLALDVKQETRAAGEALRRRFTERRRLLEKAITCLQDVLSDGYPQIPMPDTSTEIAQDAAEQARTVAIAAALFGTEPAAQIITVLGIPTQKLGLLPPPPA